MLIIISIVCVLSAIALTLCCIGFGRATHEYHRSSSATFLGTTEPEELKSRLIQRIQRKRKVVIDPFTTVVSLRYGMRKVSLRAH